MKNFIYALLIIFLSGCFSNGQASFDLEKELVNAGFTKIQLEKETSNHLVLYATVNGANSRFILDTGATNSVIDENQKERLLINSSLSDMVAAGAGGSNIPTEMGENIQLEIDDLIFDDNEYILMNLDNINDALINYGGSRVDGIIGADILIKSKAIIDYSELTMYLKQIDEE